jgi:hypothetical protein
MYQWVRVDVPVRIGDVSVGEGGYASADPYQVLAQSCIVIFVLAQVSDTSILPLQVSAKWVLQIVTPHRR